MTQTDDNFDRLNWMRPYSASCYLRDGTGKLIGEVRIDADVTKFDGSITKVHQNIIKRLVDDLALWKACISDECSNK